MKYEVTILNNYTSLWEDASSNDFEKFSFSSKEERADFINARYAQNGGRLRYKLSEVLA